MRRPASPPPVPERSAAPVARAIRLAGIRLRRPDVPRARRFFEDLGLTTTAAASDRAVLRGSGEPAPSVIIERGAPAYDGHVMQVATADELAALADRFGVEPTGGERGPSVSLTDPEGVRVDVELASAGAVPAPPTAAPAYNAPGQLSRINAPHRVPAGPVSVHAIGHTVLNVRNMRAALRWYQDTLGMIASDFEMLPDDPIPVVAFLRLDRGSEPTDHHTIALGSVIGHGHMHTAFEVRDLDAVAQAQRWLAARGHRHVWGMGRHLLGSQLFNYWSDPWGGVFELYADGDAFDAGVPTGYHAFDGKPYQWGPAMSAEMRGTASLPRLARDLATSLFGSHDLTPARLARIARATRS